VARAQACCGTTGALTPSRLGLADDALVGARTRAAFTLGTFDEHSRFHAPPEGAAELDAGLDVFAAVRIFRRAQLGALVPLVLTWRRTRTQAATGLGLGDLSLSGRVDLFNAGASRTIPGIALLAGITLPTGKAPESAERPLAVDATGTGVAEPSIGLALEQTFGAWLVNLTGQVVLRPPHEAYGVDEGFGARFSVLSAVVYGFESGMAIAGTLGFTAEGDKTLDGLRVPDTATHRLTLGVSGLWPLTETFRLQGGLSLDPPIPYLGRNQPATVATTFTALYAW